MGHGTLTDSVQNLHVQNLQAQPRISSLAFVQIGSVGFIRWCPPARTGAAAVMLHRSTVVKRELSLLGKVRLSCSPGGGQQEGGLARSAQATAL